MNIQINFGSGGIAKVLHHYLRGEKQRPAWSTLALAALIAALPGCQTANHNDFSDFGFQDATVAATAAEVKPVSMVLHEGDTVKISFPGAASLNATVTIRRDGLIALPLVGEFKAAGLTPSAMEQELIKLYAPQLQTKEVTVAVESSAFPIYLAGAVLRPGKILTDRPLTAIEAIMEAGGFDSTKANMKAVKVIRHQNGRVEHFQLNLKGVLQGKEVDPFALMPSDIIFVPERFVWF